MREREKERKREREEERKREREKERKREREKERRWERKQECSLLIILGIEEKEDCCGEKTDQHECNYLFYLLILHA